MVNIVKFKQNIILNFIIVLIFFYCKSVQGPLYPIYKNLGYMNSIFPEIKNNKYKVSLFFPVYSQIYKENLLGELIIYEKSYIENNSKVSKLDFELRVLSKNHNTHIRLREYKGILYYKNNILDLHSQDCYTYAKKNYMDRFYIIEGWNCDHLIFIFKKENDFLYHIENKERVPEDRDYFTYWFWNEKININKELINKTWYGYFIDESNDFYIFFGKDANRYLNKNNFVILYTYNKKISIDEVIGDFVFIKKKNIELSNLKNIYIYKD